MNKHLKLLLWAVALVIVIGGGEQLMKIDYDGRSLIGLAHRVMCAVGGILFWNNN
ncbi:hypothetical protein KAU09_04550 [Candidatus Parcubacteria bacterium]|nr:hypothetical protein [Candidatus Parcubacteria bacterium]